MTPSAPQKSRRRKAARVASGSSAVVALLSSLLAGWWLEAAFPGWSVAAAADASCSPSADSSAPVASLRVVADAEATGSVVEITLRLPPEFGQDLPSGWRLCFTWLKAVVLRSPRGARTTGSYVELPPQALLAGGQTRVLRLDLSPPAMRYASDLPRNLHIVLPSEAASAPPPHGTIPVELLPPAEGYVRFDLIPPGHSGTIPRPVESTSGEDISEGVELLRGVSSHPLRVAVWSESARPAADLLEAWGARQVVDGHKLPDQELVLAEASEIGDREWLGDEGYDLTVSAGEMRMIAASAGGFLRGAATFQQVFDIAHSEGRAAIPALRVRDRPRFAYRGIMLDTARHFFDVAFIKRLLHWMYLFKLNVFHWHLTDDEGWRLEVKSLPNLTSLGAWRGRGEAIPPQYGSGPERYGGFYSHADVREVVAFAEARGIAIVPEVDVPGHCFAAARALPALLGPAVRRPTKGPRSVQGFEGNVLDPAAEQTYEFLEAVLTEVLELFPAPLGVHIGMDEIPRASWSDSDEEELQLKARLAAWLQAFLAARGRKLLGWEEAFHGPGLDPKSDLRPAAMAWKQDERAAVSMMEEGFDVVLCPAHFLYLDIVQGGDFAERGLYWARPQLPIELVYSYEPLQRLRSLGLSRQAEERIQGLQANLWSETVDSEARAVEMLFPRLLAVAEVAWSAPEHRSWAEFRWRLSAQLPWLARDEGIRHGGGTCGLVAAGDFLRLPLVPSPAS